MSRVAVLLVLVFAGSATAEPPSPLDLVRGLRDSGFPDLALKYLQQIEQSKPTGEVKTILPLERAKVQLELAQQEEDAGAKDAAVAQAKLEFQAFLKANGKHPRAPEATLALARVTALEAATRLNRAGRLAQAQRMTAAAATRPEFQQAATLFGQAAKQIDGILAEQDLDPLRRRELTRDSLTAALDRGINQFKMADTFDTSNTNQVVERGKAIEAARVIFDELWRRDPANPICWVARSWCGACFLELQETNKAEELFKLIRAEAARNPAGADGVRMVEFFEAQAKFLTAKPPVNLVRQARTQIKSWLDRDRYKPRMTAERQSATYYQALLALQEAELLIPREKDGRPKDITPTARGLLQEANNDFKRLIEFDNPYSERAAQSRTRVIRLLVGNAEQAAEKFTDFEQCQMAALVQLSEANQPEIKPEVKAKRLTQAIQLLERCRQLASPAITPGLPVKEANDAVLQLAYAYLNANRPHQAAILGEHLARHGRPASTAAKGGFIGVQAYLAAMTRLDETTAADARSVDRDRAVALGKLLDTTYPADPLTDAVRFRLGRLFFDEKDYQSAFDILAKVTPAYSGVIATRAIEAQAAYAVIADKESSLTGAQKAAVFRKAVADAEAVPEPPPSAPADTARLYLALRSMLAQLHLLEGKTGGYARAEQVASDAARKAAGYNLLDEVGKKATGFAAEEVRLRAVYGQAAALYLEGKYKQLGERLTPVLAEMAKSGPANQSLTGEAALAADALDRFRQEVVTLALQGAIREGGAGAGELFDLLEKFGGSADAIVRLVAQVRPQIEELRKDKKTEEADKLVQSVAGVLEKQAANAKLPPKTVARIGQALRGVGASEKAIQVLSKVPAPPKENLTKPLAQLADQPARDLVAAHHIARLELARAYRQAKQYDKSDAVLKDALGDEKTPGWARSLEFRKEVILLLEDRAADAPQAEKMKQWREAMDGWSRIVRDYQAAVTRPPKEAAKDPDKMAQWERDREKLIPTYLLVYCDLQRCLARANMQLIADASKRTDQLGRIGQRIFESIEKLNAKSLTSEVRAAYAELMADYPPVGEGYKKAGGKAFLPGSNVQPGRG